MTFGQKLKALMAERGVSLRRLAREIHYDAGFLSKVSRDIERPSPDLARALDQYFEVGGDLAALAPRPLGELDADERQRVALAMERPSRVDAGTVDALAVVLAGQRRLEDAIGPAALVTPMAMQLDSLTVMLADNSGPYRGRLARLVAEWTVFVGWLHAAVRADAKALRLLAQAEEMADDAGDGTVAAVATSFRGYVARQQGRPRAVVRASSGALATPGAHESQRTFDRLQAAQGFAALGERDRALRLLDEAADSIDRSGDPPPPIYWYARPFFEMNIGMVHHGLGSHRDAADLIGAGLDGLPVDQQGAMWTEEYRAALEESRARA